MIDPAHLTDAELAAWYGSGLHAPKAQRLIEEVRRLRARLVGEIELRCTFQAESERGEEMVDRLRARLAAVLALCDAWEAEAPHGPMWHAVPRQYAAKVRAAARGEGDRASACRWDGFGVCLEHGCRGEGDRPATCEHNAVWRGDGLTRCLDCGLIQRREGDRG